MPMNAELLDGYWLESTNEYQQRIPVTTQNGFSATMEALFEPKNRNLFNEFQNALINRIATNIVHDKVWSNPLAPFKRGMVRDGAHIQEIMTNILKTRGYDRDANYDALKNYYPETSTVYHSINYETVIPLTLREADLKRAFIGATGEGSQLNDYLNSLLNQPLNTDQLNEYNTMLELFTEYHARIGYRQFQVPDLTSLSATTADTKAFAKMVRNLTQKMAFLGNKYNGHAFPTFSTIDDMVLVGNPEVTSNLDIELLAWAFHAEKADPSKWVDRVITIDEWQMSDCQAILCDKGHIVAADTDLETLVQETNIFTKNKTSALHHQGIFSASPFVNAVMLTTDDSTIFIPVDVTLSGVTIDYATPRNPMKEKPTFVQRGDYVQLEAIVAGGVTPEEAEEAGITVPQSTIWEIINSDARLSDRTYITQSGVLVCDPKEKSTTIQVQATTTYLDPTKNPRTEATRYVAVMTVGVDEAAPEAQAKADATLAKQLQKELDVEDEKKD